jgi:hypothetical protein
MPEQRVQTAKNSIVEGFFKACECVAWHDSIGDLCFVSDKILEAFNNVESQSKNNFPFISDRNNEKSLLGFLKSCYFNQQTIQSKL